MKSLKPEQYLCAPQEGLIRIDELVPGFHPLGEKSLDEPLNGFKVLGGLRTHSTLSRLRYEAPEGLRSKLKRLVTHDGHELVADPGLEVLCWPEGQSTHGWRALEDLEPQDRVLVRYGFGIEPKQFRFREGVLTNGFHFTLDQDMFFLLGALSTAVSRNNQWALMVSTPIQVSRLNQIAQDQGCPSLFHTPLKFSRFSGVYKLSETGQYLSCWVKSDSFRQLVLRAPLELQKSWLSGVFLTGAHWTLNRLELELSHHEVAETVFRLLLNLGVRVLRFATLDVYGQQRTKLSFHSEEDFTLAENNLWEGLKKPCTWKDRVFRSSVEDNQEAEVDPESLLSRTDVFQDVVHEVQDLEGPALQIVMPLGSDLLVNGFIVR